MWELYENSERNVIFLIVYHTDFKFDVVFQASLAISGSSEEELDEEEEGNE